MPTAATPMAFVMAICQAYQRRGLDPSTALSSADLSRSDLTDPGRLITARQLECLSHHAMRELDDEALGWFQRRLPWGSYGMLVRASLTAPTLQRALARWCRHHGLLTDDVYLSLDTHGPCARLSLHERLDLGPMREFCHVSLLRNALGVASWLIDSRIALQRTALAFAPPAHAQSYAILFPGPVDFGQCVSHIDFDARYLSLPLRRDESALQRMLQHALPLLVRPYRHDRLLPERVRQHLREHPGSTTESMATHLHLSVRTLHRQLQAHGLHWHTLKDESRLDTARELLLRSQQPIKSIATQVGFDNEKSFMRAFRQWTGTTPGAYRTGALKPDRSERGSRGSHGPTSPST